MSTSIKRSKSLGNRTKTFFGLDSDCSYAEMDAWNQRRLKFCVNKFGNLNCDKLRHDTLDTSLLDSVVANVDEMDTSLPLSSWNQAAPNVSLTSGGSVANRGYLTRSLLTPQSSVILPGGPTKKSHAFRALARVVSRTVSEHGESRSRVVRRGKQLESIYDDEDRPLPQHVFVQEAQPDHVIARSLRWSESITDRVRSGIRRMNVRRRFTDSLMGNIICCMSKQSRETKHLVSQIDDLPQYRPYFTYWICVVQIILLVTALSIYGFAPIKLDFVNREVGEVIMPNAAIEQVCRVDYVNILLGLRQADLIKLGARYSPCMRQDKNIQTSIIEDEKNRERKSGCCIRNDGGGCYQTTRKLCSTTLEIWSNLKEQGKHLVCGLDPEFCEDPRSIAPFEWPLDIVQWPICKKQSSSYDNVTLSIGSHMKCEVTGRPCCIGSKAECVITTRQHCDFLRGYYHPEAALCSQINCLNEICGMLSFYNPDRPDQFYRLFTALFLNSSIGSLVVTLVVQLTIMRDLEKMAGWHRVAIIYLLSGMIGNLTSGIFLPYQVQAGSSGSIFSLLSMTFTEFLQSWKIIESPVQVLIKFIGLGLFLFILGFLPFFDNYAHMSGFISGVLLSFIFLPFLGRPSASVFQEFVNSSIKPDVAFKKFQKDAKRKRLTVILGCSILWVCLATLCFILFYWKPITECSWCKYFNCIPLDSNFCDNMDVNITTKTACIIKD